jgi:hypothetical protein
MGQLWLSSWEFSFDDNQNLVNKIKFYFDGNQRRYLFTPMQARMYSAQTLYGQQDSSSAFLSDGLDNVYHATLAMADMANNNYSLYLTDADNNDSLVMQGHLFNVQFTDSDGNAINPMPFSPMQGYWRVLGADE